MGNKHTVELLIEANKNISQLIAKTQKNTDLKTNRKVWIEEINTIIRQLDHIVEDLEKNN